jgi:hypothetical protein
LHQRAHRTLHVCITKIPKPPFRHKERSSGDARVSISETSVLHSCGAVWIRFTVYSFQGPMASQPQLAAQAGASEVVKAIGSRGVLRPCEAYGGSEVTANVPQLFQFISREADEYRHCVNITLSA